MSSDLRPMVKIAPSMLSADFLNLGKDVAMVNANADLFHLDIMDGVFVPNISYGFPVVEAISKEAVRPLDVHLMIVHPEKYVRRFAEAGAAMISFHAEAAEDPAAVLGLVRSCGAAAGLAFNPDYPLEKVRPLLKSCDFVLVMSVFAGFGGQKFIEETYGRLQTIREWIAEDSCRCLIEVDGGVSPANSRALSEAGADILVAGSAVFRSENPAEVISSMKSL